MKTLQFYIFRHLLRMVLIFLLAIGAIVWLVDFSELSNRTSALPQYSIQAALAISGLRVPFILQGVVPFVILFASMATLITMNRKYELVIARSAGMSAWQFLRPTWFASFFVGLFVLFVLNPFATYAFTQATEIEGEWRGAGKRTAIRNQEPWLRQNSEDGGSYFITAANVIPSDQPILLQAVFIELDEDGRVKRRLEATRAKLADKQWRLLDVQEIRIRVAPRPRNAMIIPTDLNPGVITEALVQPEMISIYDLGGQIELAETFGVSAYPFRTQYQALIALPVLLITMSMIAATVSLRFARFGLSGSMILGGIGLGFMLYVVTEAAKSFGSAGIISPIIAAWLPVVAAGLLGTSFLLYREDG